MTTSIDQAWELAKQRFNAVGVDVENALKTMEKLPVSMHCWQGDDVAGFENPEGSLTGGIQATGQSAQRRRAACRFRNGINADPRAKTPESARDLFRI